ETDLITARSYTQLTPYNFNTQNSLTTNVIVRTLQYTVLQKTCHKYPIFTIIKTQVSVMPPRCTTASIKCCRATKSGPHNYAENLPNNFAQTLQITHNYV